jgi:hypothetical protein
MTGFFPSRRRGRSRRSGNHSYWAPVWQADDNYAILRRPTVLERDDRESGSGCENIFGPQKAHGRKVCRRHPRMSITRGKGESGRPCQKNCSGRRWGRKHGRSLSRTSASGGRAFDEMLGFRGQSAPSGPSNTPKHVGPPLLQTSWWSQSTCSGAISSRRKTMNGMTSRDLANQSQALEVRLSLHCTKWF